MSVEQTRGETLRFLGDTNNECYDPNAWIDYGHEWHHYGHPSGWQRWVSPTAEPFEINKDKWTVENCCQLTSMAASSTQQTDESGYDDDSLIKVQVQVLDGFKQICTVLTNGIQEHGIQESEKAVVVL